MRRGKQKAFWRRADIVPFVAAIRANPHDDLPRLVFADYLEGDIATELNVAHGQFIRWHVANPDRSPNEFFAAHGGEPWRRPLAGRVAHGVCNLQLSYDSGRFGYWMADSGMSWVEPVFIGYERGFLSVMSGSDAHLNAVVLHADQRWSAGRKTARLLLEAHPFRFEIRGFSRSLNTDGGNPFRFGNEFNARVFDLEYAGRRFSISFESARKWRRKHAANMQPGEAVFFEVARMRWAGACPLLPVIEPTLEAVREEAAKVVDSVPAFAPPPAETMLDFAARYAHRYIPDGPTPRVVGGGA